MTDSPRSPEAIAKFELELQAGMNGDRGNGHQKWGGEVIGSIRGRAIWIKRRDGMGGVPKNVARDVRSTPPCSRGRSEWGTLPFNPAIKGSSIAVSGYKKQFSHLIFCSVIGERKSSPHMRECAAAPAAVNISPKCIASRSQKPRNTPQIREGAMRASLRCKWVLYIDRGGERGILLRVVAGASLRRQCSLVRYGEQNP